MQNAGLRVHIVTAEQDNPGSENKAPWAWWWRLRPSTLALQKAEAGRSVNEANRVSIASPEPRPCLYITKLNDFVLKVTLPGTHQTFSNIVFS